jgi:C4-dicarboxylate-specific signal transduction histidine kinase
MDDAMEQHHGDEGAPSRNPHPGAGGGAADESTASAGVGDAADRLSTLTHELGGLLDGSLRWLGLASRALAETERDSEADGVERARKQVETVRSSLLRMTELVRSAGGAAGPRFGAGGLGGGPSVAEAASHALDVVQPRATDLGVSLRLRVAPGAGRSAAGPLYSVLLNGVRNGVDSIERALHGQPGEGCVDVAISEEDGHTVITIADDGAGVPLGAGRRVFEPGFTTRKDGQGRGIGLALCRQVVSEVGGSIALHARGDGPRGGAVLVVRVPAMDGEDRGDG